MKISSQQVLSPDGSSLSPKVLVFEGKKLVSIDEIEAHDPTTVQFVDGILCPGFINTHCHLELSHMLGKVDTGTGLVDFIKQVVTQRNVDEVIIQEAIQHADAEMYQNGIQAVGDISNTTDTLATKSKSKIIYHTFVEFFDLYDNNLTQAEFAKYENVWKLYKKANLLATAVPHAPYSVTPQLHEQILTLQSENDVVSIHNQETPSEIAFIQEGKGKMVDFYNEFSLDTSLIKGHHISPLEHAVRQMSNKFNTLFVHNTLTTASDIETAYTWNNNSFFVTCPNANLYIENRLPNYSIFQNGNARMTIGTDSLTSNWQLSILDEMRSIQKYASYVSLIELLKWGTINGAEALNLQDELGSLSIGKKPGLLLIKDVNQNRIETIGGSTQVERIL